MQYPYLIIYARGIFMDKPIDPNWTTKRPSVCNGRNKHTRLWILNKRETIPTLIRWVASTQGCFLKKPACITSPTKPQRIIHQNLFWDDERGGFCYSKRGIPLSSTTPRFMVSPLKVCQSQRNRRSRKSPKAP